MKFLSRFTYPVFTILILQLVAPFSVRAQSDNLKSLVAGFNYYSEHHFQEKMFVHLDRSFYLIGETMWFKIYTVNGMDHKPANLSKVAYVEVLDKEGVAVLQTKMPLSNGQGKGSLDIGDLVRSGNYQVRAYTSWMKNYQPDYFFHQAITIVNTTKENDVSSSTRQATYDIQFFPEGGNLVYGLSSKVGFKLNDKDGKGSEFRGYILNQHNDTLVRFQPLKFGMGNFIFTPEENATYKAVIIPTGQKSFSKELPAIYQEGYVVKLQQKNPGFIQLDVSYKSPKRSRDNEVLYLIAHTRQSVKVAEFGRLNNGTATFLIDPEKLGEGISYFTIFNEAKQPLCERLYFNYPKQDLHIDLNINKSVLNTREKVILDISTTNELGNEEAPEMSMSVFLGDSLEPGTMGDIRSYLWLSSGLEGFIENPSYYFERREQETVSAMDNLMLTQGWRRFRWEEVLQSKESSFKYVPEYRGHLIRGKVLDLKTREAGKNIVVYLSSPGKPGTFYAGTTNENGEVLFPAKNMYGLTNIIVQTNSEKDSIYAIEILNPFSEDYSDHVLPSFNLSRQLKKNLLDRSVNASSSKVFSGKPLNLSNQKPNDSLYFYGHPDRRYYLDDYTRFPSMEEVMREYVEEVHVRRRRHQFYFMVSNRPFQKIFETEPLILLDGVPIFDTDRIMAFNPLKVEKLDVIAGRYFYGPVNATGIVSYSTYKGDLGDFKLDPKAVIMEYEGLQAAREFYAPDYESESSRKSRVPDFRNLLFWSPDITANASGKSQVNFYTSDQQGKYTIVIQGLSKDGRAGAKVMHFEVKNGL